MRRTLEMSVFAGRPHLLAAAGADARPEHIFGPTAKSWLTMVRKGYAAAGLLAALALTACAGSPPTLEGAVASTPPPPALTNGKQAPSGVGTEAAPSAAKPNVATGPQTITGFKKPSVILYSSPTGADGQRVPTATMPLPLPARIEAAASKRLEVMTLDGLRWIARSDVVLAEATQRER